MAKEEDLEITKTLQLETQSFKQIQANIDKVLDINDKLKHTQELKDQFTQLKDDATLPLPTIFRRILRMIAKTKYYFITNPEKVIEENLKRTSEILETIDQAVVKIGN